MNNQIRNKITYLTFFLSICIVWHHAYNVEVYGINGGLIYTIEKYTWNIFDLAVQVFFTLSAFLFFYNYEENKLFLKFKKRLISLVCPYLLWNAIGYIYFQLLSLFPILREYYGGNISEHSLKGFILASINGDYNLVTWFLRALIIYTFITPLFYKFIKNKRICILIFVISIFIFDCLNITNVYCENYKYYLFGMMIAIHHKNYALYINKRKHSIIAIIIFLFLFALYNIFEFKLYIKSIMLLISICLLWVGFDIIDTKKTPKSWMKYSFVSFVSHEMILEPIEKIIYILFGSSVFAAGLDYIAAPIITYCLIIVFCTYGQKIPTFWKILTGGR